MLKREILPIDNIYVPSKRRATLKPEHVLEIAESMLDKGQETPILVRPDGTATCWSKDYIGSKPPRRWARPQSSDIWCKPLNIK